MIKDPEDDMQKIIDHMMEIGVIEINGYDPVSDEITYSITPKCKELMPEFYNEHFSFVNEIAFELWNKGYIEMMFDLDGVPMVMIDDKIDYYKDVIPHLNQDERFFIENLIRNRML